mgnify:CR=1 FL=1
MLVAESQPFLTISSATFPVPQAEAERLAKLRAREAAEENASKLAEEKAKVRGMV